MKSEVKKVFRSLKTYELALRPKNKPAQWTLPVPIGRGLSIGGRQIIVMAGPCSIESRAQLLKTARAVQRARAHVLRGGAFKPCTFPYRFRGLKQEGLKIIAEVGRSLGLPIITEVMDVRDVPEVCQYTDILQVGARNMQNYNLLVEVGKTDKPVFLKRGMWANIDELLGAAEYILKEGNPHVMLCERGIVTFENHTRWTLSIPMVAELKHRTHLPVVVDPSHGTGRRHLVEPMALAAIAAGADGLMIEVHPDPDRSVSDWMQALRPQDFSRLMERVSAVAQSVGRTIDGSGERKTLSTIEPRTLVASRALKSGIVLERRHLAIRKNGRGKGTAHQTGVTPRLLNNLIGRRLLYDLRAHDPITLGVVEL